MGLLDFLALSHPFSVWTAPRGLRALNGGSQMLHTPYYLIDKAHLLPNLEKIRLFGETSGAKALLALKCFGPWSVFRHDVRVYGRHDLQLAVSRWKLGRERVFRRNPRLFVALGRSRDLTRFWHSDKVIFNHRRDSLTVSRR